MAQRRDLLGALGQGGEQRRLARVDLGDRLAEEEAGRLLDAVALAEAQTHFIANDDAEAQKTYLHRGLAERDFERRFQLADYVVVTEANLVNGLLSISLKRELPEALKPRRIEIGGAKPLIEGKTDKAKAA